MPVRFANGVGHDVVAVVHNVRHGDGYRTRHCFFGDDQQPDNIARLQTTDLPCGGRANAQFLQLTIAELAAVSQ